MKREFNYEDITIADIENNTNLIFVCDADIKKVIVERENEDGR